MALDTKLKSDMTGNIDNITGTGEENPLPNKTVEPMHVNEPKVNSSTTETILEPEIKFSPKETSQGDQKGSFSGNVEAMLKMIEKQLQSLNQNVADLEEEVNASRNPDYRTIFSKIDSARCSIESAISVLGASAKDQNDQKLLDKISALETIVSSIAEKQDRNDRQLTQTLRENANFQIQVRQGMQHDLDKLREQQNGEQFNPILKEIASIYVEYQGLLEDETISGLSRKNLAALFEQMEDVFLDYGAEISRSEVGTTRQTRSTKIIGKIATGEQEKHNTIAASRKPGVVRDRTVLYPEFVDVYIFDPTLSPEAHVAEENPGDAMGEVIIESEQVVFGTKAESVAGEIEKSTTSESEDGLPDEENENA